MTEPARALLPMLNADEVSAGVQRILHAATKGNYQDPNIMRVLANAPELLSKLLDYSKFLLYDSDIEPRLIELVRINSTVISSRKSLKSLNLSLELGYFPKSRICFVFNDLRFRVPDQVRHNVRTYDSRGIKLAHLNDCHF